jgi:hypothetical protein
LLLLFISTPIIRNQQHRKVGTTREGERIISRKGGPEGGKARRYTRYKGTRGTRHTRSTRGTRGRMGRRRE